MKSPIRRSTLRALAATALGATLVVSTVLVSTLLATSASATSAPPWEPVGNPPQVGGLTFYNSSGQVITGGNISDDPIAAYVQGNATLQGAATLADLNGFTPVIDVNPGAWNEVQFSGSATPNASAPGALGTSTLPLYTGVSGYSLSNLTETYPNNDTSGDGYAGIYVLRLQTFQHPNTSTNYDSADISVDPSTGAWTLVYSPQATTTTTLAAPTPAAPQPPGTSVTLNATVTDVSAPGTVQFESDGDAVGSPVTVVDGAAQLVTTALPLGNDSLTAVFTPTTGAAFSGSTSNTVPYDVANTVPGAPTGASATPGHGQATVSFTAPVSNGGATITGYTVTATDTTTPANGGQTGTGSDQPDHGYGSHQR